MTWGGGGILNVLYQFNSSPLLRFLEELTGIKGLIPDPYYEGGGLHQIERNGFLQIHADFNHYSKLNVHRRINLLLYLNKEWRDEYGGHLELWNREMTRCVKKILPIYNRCVIFSVSDWAYHGHPEKLMCPADRTRKSLALYYYTVSPAEEVSEPHGTLYQVRPSTAQGSKKLAWKARRAFASVVQTLGSVLGFPGKMLERLGKSLAPPKF